MATALVQPNFCVCVSVYDEKGNIWEMFVIKKMSLSTELKLNPVLLSEGLYPIEREGVNRDIVFDVVNPFPSERFPIDE